MSQNDVVYPLTWHLVSEKQPKVDGSYLVMLGNDSYEVAEYSTLHQQWWVDQGVLYPEYWATVPRPKPRS